MQVPKGYDGIVVALFGNLADTTDRYLYEYYTDQTEFTFIRLN